mmetsp:Transcript_4872/g.11887  ORF Transcript_4872/g.11887 Transcript_4872/m.11887 type:complete len:99 (+) Transcript_4872:1607-1903(+)
MECIVIPEDVGYMGIKRWKEINVAVVSVVRTGIGIVVCDAAFSSKAWQGKALVSIKIPASALILLTSHINQDSYESQGSANGKFHEVLGVMPCDSSDK